MTLPSKKRLLSDSESLPPIEMESPKQDSPKPRKDSGAGESAASDDTAAMALRALSALDVHSQIGRHPLKKRKASMDCWEDDQTLGLVPTQTSEEDKPTPPKSNTEESRKGHDAMGCNALSTALDHLDALGDGAASLDSKQKERKVAKPETEDVIIEDEESSNCGTLASSNQLALLGALMSTSSAGGGYSYRRDRLESWGGMSDLSAAGLGSEGRIDAATAITASALHYTGLYEDLTAAANSDTGSLASQSSWEKANAVPSRISVTGDRKNSAGSEVSMFNLEQMTPSMQAFMDAAMVTVGDKLAEIAGDVEMAAAGTDIASISSDYLRKEAGIDSDASSTMSPLIGSIPDLGGRPRSLSTSSKPLSVDYDAVAAAVDAAQAATSALDLTAITGTAAPESVPSIVMSTKNAVGSVTNGTSMVVPLHQIPIPKSTMSEKDMEAIRERARAAAGYIPPSGDSPATPAPRPPLKKRQKQMPPNSHARYRACPPISAQKSTNTAPRPDLPLSTPKISNALSAQRPLIATPATSYPPNTPSAELFSSAAKESKASSQKWDDMFECLVQFVKDRKAEELKGASDKEKEEWEWDGNVPTLYKTKDGKALGRWVNNQRSSKTKGNLKKDREEKLISTGLKWSVLVTNSWQDMMHELKLYVKEKTKNGEEWDGNVPTNYSIKGKSDEVDEDKNLGRWINRQRSMYQAGKLRKDRQKQLEDIGLRWSVLSTTSWDAMYDTLCQYVKERKAAADPNRAWDGNVPANHKTNDNPPKALGRWVNRQRSAYGKGQLKKEFVDKLNAIGLRWSVHERRAVVSSSSPDNDDD